MVNVWGTLIWDREDAPTNAFLFKVARRLATVFCKKLLALKKNLMTSLSQHWTETLTIFGRSSLVNITNVVTKMITSA